MNPRYLLRAEGIAVFAAATAAYYLLDGALWLYVLLFFAPDLGMIGYLANPRVGSATYNAVHTYTLPLSVFAIGAWQALPQVMLVAVIWTAHIGFDRALGYGLKFPSMFGDTHLGRERFTATDEPMGQHEDGAASPETKSPQN